MKIGAFIKAVKTTKDTVRYYGKLGMIQLTWIHNRRIYAKKDVQDFDAIKEMQELGMSLREIQLMSEIKRNNGCGSLQLLAEVMEKMQEKQKQLRIKEQTIKHRKEQVGKILAALNGLTVINIAGVFGAYILK